MTPNDNLIRTALAVSSFLAMAVGFWMAWRPLGLIVPGAIVFSSLCYSHLTVAEEPSKEPQEETISA